MTKGTPAPPAISATQVLPGQPPAALDPARWMYARIIRSIEEFEKGLTPDEEIGARLVATPGEDVFHVQHVAFWSPDMIVFGGVSANGRRVQLLQHYSQLSLMLTSVPKGAPEEAPRRIGFELVKKMEAEKWGDPQV
jgi:hypothetical protein